MRPILVWVKQGKARRHLVSADSHTAQHFIVKNPKLCALCILLSLCLSSCAFFVPNQYLPFIALFNGVLLLQGRYLGGGVKGLFLLFTTQLAITCALYLLLHGGERIDEAVLAVIRILLAIIPGWWLSITCAPQRIGEVLSWCMPHKWAFVMAACFSLLPRIGLEVKDTYQMQVMRGANITPKALCRPKHWGELIYCVLYPLLIQLLKLSKQMALAAKLRRFGVHHKPTHWPD